MIVKRGIRYAGFMKKILNIYVSVFIFLIPLFFLPVMNNGFAFAKVALLVLGGVVGLVLWIVSRTLGKKDNFKINSIFGLVALFLIWAGVSFFRLPVGVRAESLMSATGFGAVVGLVIWLFLWIQTAGEENRRKQLLALTASGIVTGIVGLIIFLLPESKLPIVWPTNNPLVSINIGWSLTGSLLGELVLLGFLLLTWGSKLVKKVKTGGYVKEGVVSAVLLLTLGIVIYKIAKVGWVVLDYSSSWIIAAETFKRSAIFGVGIGNFLQAFNLFRPESYNLTAYWSTVFNGSAMGVLQIWTELGVVGLGLVAILVMKVIRGGAGIERIKMLAILAMVLLLPLNFIGLFLAVWMMAGYFEMRKVGMVLKVGEKGFNAAPVAFGALIVIGTLFAGITYGRMIAGEVFMRQSFVKAAANDGVGTYNDQIKAIGANPNLADYRRIYSQTNIALAQSILTVEEGVELSEEDRERASLLIEQAVREAKAAIALDNYNATYWSNLAAIYRALIGVVDESADWALQAYQQAAALDPVNPLIKLDLGGLLFAAGNYEAADRVFEEVVKAKPDFANGWYNWAHTARQINRIDYAVERLSQALVLVPVDSGDYETASKELEEWKKELEAAIAQAKAAAEEQAQREPETLRTPDPLPAGGEERVNVTEADLQPPEAPVLPVEPSQTPEGGP